MKAVFAVFYLEYITLVEHLDEKCPKIFTHALGIIDDGSGFAKAQAVISAVRFWY
jgi:hypothetical protein